MLSHQEALNPSRRLRFSPATSTRMSSGTTFEKIPVRTLSSRELAHKDYLDDPSPATRIDAARYQLNFHCQTEGRPKAQRRDKDDAYWDQRPNGSKAFSHRCFPLAEFSIVDMRDRDDVFYEWSFDDGFGSDDEQYTHRASPFRQSVDDIISPKPVSASRSGKKQAQSPSGTVATSLSIRDSVQQLLDRGKELEVMWNRTAHQLYHVHDIAVFNHNLVIQAEANEND